MSVSFEQIDDDVRGRVKIALAVVAQFGTVVETYLFGAYVEGTASPGSDVDLAVFVEDLASWDPMDQIEMVAKATTSGSICSRPPVFTSPTTPALPPGS